MSEEADSEEDAMSSGDEDSAYDPAAGGNQDKDAVLPSGPVQ
jgi:hypothetical protein